jgi:hypothetical protein
MADRLLGLPVLIPPGAWISPLIVALSEVSATGRSLFQRSPAKCGVSEFNRENLIIRSFRPTGAVKS